MTITIIGVGLIGGSLALNLKKQGWAERIIGVDNSDTNLDKALTIGLIDKKAPLAPAVQQADLIILAIPMSGFEEMLPSLLNLLTDQQILMDVGSTKRSFLQQIFTHKNRSRLVATHPMAGTEYSGPEAAFEGLFTDKCCVFCDAEDSDEDALQKVREIYESLHMHIVYMSAEAHDRHAAYVSHIAHISSFALALTVLEKEKEERHIFELASGGFNSTVRLAKSSPAMWAPIFADNHENILTVLDEMISQLHTFKASLKTKNEEELYRLIEKANAIKRIIE